uniref:Glycerophosphodiester phosphodiesterase domain containing 2 n=1 Tax=Dicentrarchus labrax TaxID=13489 RepID=A0A8C4HEZ3_DICLA
VVFITFGVVGIGLIWKQEWPIVPLSLQFLIAVAFIAVSAAIFLCPLYIQSPCLIEVHELPEKPKLIGHRGAPMLAPENTMMSFEKSIACGVTAFETDIQLSKDRIPFLMHDNNFPGFLRRTTDIKDKFPEKANSRDSANFTWEELQSLNAGDWFVKTDPFHSVSYLSEDDIEAARNQTIPSLLQLLNLAKEHNISVIFDIYSPEKENETDDIVKTILHSGIDRSRVLWLPPTKREHVKKIAPGFTHFYKDITYLHTQIYTAFHRFLALSCRKCNLSVSKSMIVSDRKHRSSNVTVNIWGVNERWLFSLLWCSGASSVTTNSCHILKDMDRPDWVLALRTYKIIWITVDIASIVIITGIYILQW